MKRPEVSERNYGRVLSHADEGQTFNEVLTDILDVLDGDADPEELYSVAHRLLSESGMEYHLRTPHGGSGSMTIGEEETDG